MQTCRGSHTHTVVVDPKDTDNVYVYISGSSGVRSAERAAGLRRARAPSRIPNSALFRIEVIKVPLAHPEQAAIVSSPRIFNDLAAPARARRGAGGHRGATKAVGRGARRRAGSRRRSTARRSSCRSSSATPLLDSIVEGARRHGRADRGRQRRARGPLPDDRRGDDRRADRLANGEPPARRSATTSPSIPAIGLAGGACGGLRAAARHPAIRRIPTRIDAVADSNFSYWHSATFNNDGTKMLFSDEWGGGGQPQVPRDRQDGVGRRRDLHDRRPARCSSRATTRCRRRRPTQENCVAHNGSLIPIPGRDVMVQAWYQGGISVFDWTDAAHPKEIAFFDRGPVDSTRMAMRRLLVGLLVQRRHRQLRDRARPRHLRAHAERAASRRTRSTRRRRCTWTT